MRRHHGQVIALCASMLGDRSSAEDAAQEAFLKAYGSLGAFRQDSSFATWLHRIALNCCMDALRKAKRRPAVSWDALLEEEGERLHGKLGLSQDPRSAVEDADLAAKVLACLPEAYRAVLVLREVNGLSYEELSWALDCTVDAVKARLRRARGELEEKLRHILGADGV